MISIGDSDDSDNELVLTRPIVHPSNVEGQSNGYHVANGYHSTREEIRRQTEEYFTWEDLQSATVAGNRDLVKTIIDKGEFDVNTPLTSGWTLLMYAAEQSHYPLVTYFLNVGADVNFHHQMFYPIMACFNRPHLPPENVRECVRLLLENEVMINVHDKHHMSPLMYCARHPYCAALELLCQSNVDINKQDQRGWTALMHAADQNRRDSIDILLKYNASVYIQSFDSQLTCADIAYSCGYQQLYEYLEKKISPETDVFRQAQPTCDVDKGNEAPKYHKMRELELFLTSQDMSSLIPLFNEQKITFDMLLTMNQKDLERIGISQIGFQQKLLTAIKGVHGSEFEMPDMSQSLYNLELNCRDCSKVMKTYTKHLKYLRATSEYLLKQCQSSKKMDDEYPTNAPEDSGLINHFLNVFEVSSTLHDNIQAINDTLSEKLKIQVVENSSRTISESSRVKNTSYFLLGVTLGALISFAGVKSGKL